MHSAHPYRMQMRLFRTQTERVTCAALDSFLIRLALLSTGVAFANLFITNSGLISDLREREKSGGIPQWIEMRKIFYNFSECERDV